MSARLTIANLMADIASQHNKTLPPLTDDLVLNDTGFDSLCFAILVARLEDELGTDPFTSAEEAYFPVTFGDFVNAYERVQA